jgi:DNA repair protein RadC
VLLRHRCIAKGTATHCAVDPRDIFHVALATRAAAIVLVHNHPSGDATPSPHDVALTRQLSAGARPLCIRIADHLVIGDGAWTSMLAAGLLEPEAPAVAPLVMEREP